MYQLETCQSDTLLRVRGEVDISTEASFRQALDFARQNTSGHVVVVLDDCPYFDAAGLGELIRAHNVWGDRLTVVLPEDGNVNRVFALTGLDRVLHITNSVAAALPGLVMA